MREHYPLPTIEDVTTRLKDAKVFSVVGAKLGFWQIRLEEESSIATTFNTPFGRYRWKRMPFGLNSAPEVFQRRMHEVEDLKGVEVIADDFLVFGCGKTVQEASTDHDNNMIKMLDKARKANLRMNGEKLRFKVKETRFIGHVLSANGVHIDPRKVEAIGKMPIPTNVAELRRFLGMVQYLSKFLNRLSDMTNPLRKLTEENADWNWTEEVGKAYAEIINCISKAPVLAYYDVGKEVTIQCDASESGLGGVLLQEGKPIYFTSRGMTTTEQRYAQIEKEMLAIVHSCMKFEQYIYGRPKVTVHTDHKPLETIFKKPVVDCPKRLQRMLLYLQKFTLEVSYRRGSELYIADTLSRAYLKETGPENVRQHVLTVEEKMISDLEDIRTIDGIPNKKRRFQELRDATTNDPVIQRLISVIRNGWPDERKKVPAEVKAYYDFKEELVVEDGLVLKGMRIVIPTQERKTVLNNLHISHNGIQGTLQKARDCDRRHQGTD
jgi:hypothetical protein